MGLDLIHSLKVQNLLVVSLEGKEEKVKMTLDYSLEPNAQESPTQTGEKGKGDVLMGN
jgi:hypothetical protein